MASTGESKVEFWTKKWSEGIIGWHRGKTDERLQKYVNDLTKNKAGVPVLVTWCGKSLDVPWLCQEGYDVVGVEVSETAVKCMFEENAIPYSTFKQEEFIVYQANDRKLKIFAGNFYKLTPDIAGTFEAIWDNHAFGAAEPGDRKTYAQVLESLLNPKGRILLSAYEYGNKIREEAPFSISHALLSELFLGSFEIQFLESPEEYVLLPIKAYDLDWLKQQVYMLSLK